MSTPDDPKMLDATREALSFAMPKSATAALAEVAAAERVIEAANQMRHAAIPVQTHGVARHSVEEFDAALRDLAALNHGHDAQ